MFLLLAGICDVYILRNIGGNAAPWGTPAEMVDFRIRSQLFVHFMYKFEKPHFDKSFAGVDHKCGTYFLALNVFDQFFC